MSKKTVVCKVRKKKKPAARTPNVTSPTKQFLTLSDDAASHLQGIRKSASSLDSQASEIKTSAGALVIILNRISSQINLESNKLLMKCAERETAKQTSDAQVMRAIGLVEDRTLDKLASLERALIGTINDNMDRLILALTQPASSAPAAEPEVVRSPQTCQRQCPTCSQLICDREPGHTGSHSGCYVVGDKRRDYWDY